MFTISLHNLIFHSFHGIHDEERILGNTFIVNVDINYHGHEIITELGQTVNYVTVYNIIKSRMLIPTALLETLAQDIASLIHSLNTDINSISVSIEKKNPPISNIEGAISVKYTKEW